MGSRDSEKSSDIVTVLDGDTTRGRFVGFTVSQQDSHDHGHRTKRGLDEKASANSEDKDDGVSKAAIDEHQLSLDALAALLKTSFNVADPARSAGLAQDEAQLRLEKDGRNVLTPQKRKSALRMYFDCLFTMFNVLLMISGVLVYVVLAIDYTLPNTWLGGILIFVAFLNAFIWWIQLQKSNAILDSFLAMIPPTCRVLRGGSVQNIPASDLVKGDVVLIRLGDKVPADLVVFNSTELKIDNSSLTGESEPQERRPNPEGSTRNAMEAENLVFNSNLIVSGEGWGVVIRTGDQTMIGRIAALTGGEKVNKSPIDVEIGRFVYFMSTIAGTFAIVFFCVGISTVYSGKISSGITFCVSVLTAFIPQGLPSVVTLLLSVAAKRMAARNVLVKDLQGVETLGSLTLLATDKTGTLTRNQMTVANVWSAEKMYNTLQTKETDPEIFQFNIEEPHLRDIVDASIVNSFIKFDKQDVPFAQRTILGDATEAGLARFATKYVSDFDVYKQKFKKTFEIPFNSANKWALVIVNKPHESGQVTAYLKGAPERVLQKCSAYLKNGKPEPISSDFQEEYEKAYDFMASRGHRVLGFAQALLPELEYPSDYVFSKDTYAISEYCFLGLVSLEDPPKHGVRQAIGTLRMAGIKVMMVTGDHPKTAEAIARRINLITGDTRESLSTKAGRDIDEVYEDEVEAIVVHGDIIDKLQDWQWDQIFGKREIVFARTSPQHKLEIVKRAQSLGHIVGVTGDGVNDSPALKKADLGISMNMTGSDVSKEAANMILLDDNFASTVNGVQEGRLIFINLKKSIRYTLSHLTPEIIPQLLNVVVPLPLPLTAMLILMIDLGYEIFVGLSFAFDPPETMEGVMRMQPRKPVTEQSIRRTKKRAIKTAAALQRDIETLKGSQPGRMRRMIRNIRSVFTTEFWQDLFGYAGQEALVNWDLLSYSYLEIGVIESIGSLLAYFVIFYKSGFSPSDLKRAANSNTSYFEDDSPDFINHEGRSISGPDQVTALAKAQSIVYLSIFMMQCFNVFAVKAKFRFPFGRHVVSNKWNFAGILLGACTAMLVVYVPPFHVVFGGSYHTSPLYWLIAIGFGVVILIWACLRVLVMRKSIESMRVKDIKGLMMFPTMRTMSLHNK